MLKSVKFNIKSLSLILLLTASFTFFQCENDIENKVLVPKQTNNYTWIYKPSGDYFFGPDTKHLKEGKWYEEWVPNDHTFIKDESGKWHVFGITHPLIKAESLVGNVHQGEYASFHAISSGGMFNETVTKFHYKDLPKVLSPKERPNEMLSNHAPYIFRKDGLYHMIYGPSPIRLAVSSDLYKWETRGKLFREKEGARDPNLLFHEGVYYVVYCSKKCVKMRKSTDLINWSEAETILVTNKFDPESPSLIYHNNSFYLFVCSWDGNWDGKDIKGAYQNKTYVYNSKDSIHFGTDHEKEITTLKSHAPEIFKDENSNWYISSVEWPFRGVSIDKIFWE